MELVIKDGSGEWFFDGDKTYFLFKDGQRLTKIYAEYIADPVKLWQSKAELAGIDVQSEAAKKLRPSESIFKLWDHAYANRNK